jgi:hypothetical protein
MRDIKGNIEEQIADAVEAIKEAAQFGWAYGFYPCFRGKVNTLYNQTIKSDPDYDAKKLDKKTIDDTSKVVPRAAIYIWRTKLTEAQTYYAQCLQAAYTQQQQQGGQNTVPSPTILVDTGIGEGIGPFDRRLDRLLIKDDSEGPYPVIPYSTRYRDAATIGFVMSEDMVRNSEIENQDEVALAISAKRAEMQSDPFYQGVPSLINTYSISKLYGSNGGEYLINRKDERKWYEIDTTQDGRLAYSLNPTTTSIINWGEGDPYGRTPYHFSDFVFCKYWNIIPNNRMITLRRFPAPVLDNLKFPGMDGNTSAGTPSDNSDPNLTKDAAGNLTSSNANASGGTNSQGGGSRAGITEDQGSGKKVDFPPMATAITYFGEETGNQLSDILKFTTGFNWGEVESDVYKVETASTPELESGPAGLFGGLGSMAKTLNIATGNFDTNAILNEGNLPPDPYNGGPYENRIIGPVNAITKVRKRERGLQYESKISLTFEYVARPIGGVNTKAVLLDIISNFLVIGSATAMFWGGQHRFMGQPQRYPFIGGDKGIQQWYRGNPIGWAETSVQSLTSKVRSLGDMAGEFFSQLLGGGSGGGLLGNIKNILSGDNIAGNFIRHGAAVRSNGQIPYLTGLRALLIGEPVGEWHITIGNPLNPIAMIGNLICDNIEVELGNELGPDDFPLEAKITVNLEHGMARDRDAIQSMFNRGMGRIYDLPDTYAGSADYETKVDKVTGNTSATGRSPADWRSGNVFATSATTGGTTGRSQNVENALHTGTSVWNRAKFAAVSPNQTTAFTAENIWSRSSFRAGSWVSLKTLK